MNKEIENIVCKLSEEQLKDFLKKELYQNNDLLDSFRRNFISMMPKISPIEYKNKIEGEINKISDKGFISYSLSFDFESLMYKYVLEAEELYANNQIKESIGLIKVIFDILIEVSIDDSMGSTTSIGCYCIEILSKIIVDINDNNILKELLDFIIDEGMNGWYANYGHEVFDLTIKFIDKNFEIEYIKKNLYEIIEIQKNKKYSCTLDDATIFLIKILKIDKNFIEIEKIYSMNNDNGILRDEVIDMYLSNNKEDKAVEIMKKYLIQKNNYRCDLEYIEKIIEIYEHDNDNLIIFLDYVIYDVDFINAEILKKYKTALGTSNWNELKHKLYDKLKKDSDNDENVKIFLIEENMIDELYLYIKNNYKYNCADELNRYYHLLMPKYEESLFRENLNELILRQNWLNDRKSYKSYVSEVQKLTRFTKFKDEYNDFVNELKDNFSSRPAMLDEIIKGNL